MKAIITRQQIAKLQAVPGKDQYLWDPKISGYCVKCTPKGTKSFYFVYRMGGRGTPSRRLLLGRCDWMTPEQARDEASQAKRAVFRGVDPFEEKKRELGILFNDVATEWLEGYSKTKRKTQTHGEDRRLLERIILPTFQGRYLSKITNEEIEQLHNQYAATPAQSNRILNMVSLIFKRAIFHKHLPVHANACAGIKRFKEHPRSRHLQDDEIWRLLATLEQCQKTGRLSLSFIHLIKLLLFTGCRKDEIRKLKWAQVDLPYKLIHLLDAKTGPRTVHLNELAVSILKSIRKSPRQPYVIPSPTNGKYLGDTAHPWKSLCMWAGLDNFRIHDLRHTYASLGVALGVPLYTTGKLLGHSRQETTARYSHLNVEPLQLATEAISAKIQAITATHTGGEVVTIPPYVVRGRKPR